MSDYTPSTEEVREQYWAASGEPSPGSESKPEFDRWLAAHDREVAERCAVIAESVTEGWHPDHSMEIAVARNAAVLIRREFAAPTPVTEENQP